MNNELIAGIREDELANLSVEILDYADRIADIFNRLNTCMDELPSHYQGSAGTALMKRYQEIASSFTTVQNNIVSYSDDLNALLHKMRDADKEFASLFQAPIDEIRHKTNQIQQISNTDLSTIKKEA